MKMHLMISLKLALVTLTMFGILYPLVITSVGRLIAPNGGKGKEIVIDGKVIGFELIGQKFDNDRYFNGRPSAVDYNAASTGGSNKGPNNPDYLELVQARIDTLLAHNPTLTKGDIPVDLVTTSGGGLDPHISPQAARIQIDRISRVRGINRKKLEGLVEQYVEPPIIGLGTSRVHVLRLNIALDQIQ